MAGVDWKSVVGTVAPTIATALGGPLAGLATAAIAGVFGLGDDTTEAQLAAAVGKASPDALLELKKADQNFAVRLRELDVDIERIAMSDRVSARERETNTGDKWTPRLLAWVTLIAFFACVYFVLNGQLSGLDAAQMGIVGGIIGYASAKADTVIAYYFGSSSETAEKNQMLFNSTPVSSRRGEKGE